MPAELTQICSRCGKNKPLDEFYHNRTKNTYHNSICKECQLEVNRINREKK